MAGLLPASKNIYARYVAGSLSRKWTVYRHRIGQYAPNAFKVCMFICVARDSFGFDVPAIPIVVRL